MNGLAMPHTPLFHTLSYTINIMELHGSFRSLSRVVERLESAGWRVSNAAVRTGDEGSRLDASVDLVVPFDDVIGTDDGPSASLAGDGRLQVTFELPPLVPTELDSAVSIRETDVELCDGSVLVSTDLAVRAADDGGTVGSPSAGTADERSNAPTGSTGPGEDDEVDTEGTTDAESRRPAETGAHPDALADELAAVRDDSLPPYEDTPYLTALYERCDNFREMRDLIGMDVSSETVRRYMIDVGVHEPQSYDTAERADADDAEPEANGTESSGEGEVGSEPEPAPTEAGQHADPVDELDEERLVADGVGLTDGIHLEDVADAVAESMTIYQVQKRLGLERSQTRALLENLDLLDLVLRRATSDPDEASASREQIAARIRGRSVADDRGVAT